MAEADAADSRGQLLIIAGLLLAVLFAGLAIVLNGAIYAENLSTRESTSSAAPLAADPVTQQHMSEVMARANYGSETADYGQRRAIIRQNVSKWGHRQANSSAEQGQYMTTEVTGMQNGTRVAQSDTGEFMPAGEDLTERLLDTTLDPFGITDRTSWLVVSDANTRSFDMTVEKSSLKTVDGDLLDDLANLLSTILTGNDAFWVQFDDGSSVWRVYLVEADDNITAVVTEDDGTEDVVGTCQINGEQATIRFGENELVSGEKTESCPELSFMEKLDAHDMYFVGGDNAKGTYRFILDERESDFHNEVEDEYDDFIDDLLDGLTCWTGVLGSCDDDVYESSPGDGNPYTTTAVYDTSVEMTYRTDRIAYTRNVTLAPE
jgi:hypothetical protein